MGFFDFLFGARKRQVQLFLENDAKILDVRTKNEFDSGAIPNAIHVPLQDLHKHVEELKAMDTPFVVCCEAGVRAAKAVKFLNINNIEATNGGGWLSLGKNYNLID